MTHPIFDLSGRTALITGSGQGIGLSLAKGLAQAGAAVILNGRDAAKLDAAAETLRAGGASVRILPFDVTDHAAARAAIDGFEADTVPIDILVNNAGMQFRTPLEDYPVEMWEKLLATNVSSVFHVGQAVAAPHDRARPGQDRQHRQRPDRAGPSGDRALHRDQGRGGQPDQGDGDRLGPQGVAGQRHRARATSTRR